MSCEDPHSACLTGCGCAAVQVLAALCYADGEVLGVADAAARAELAMAVAFAVPAVTWHEVRGARRGDDGAEGGPPRKGRPRQVALKTVERPKLTDFFADV